MSDGVRAEEGKPIPVYTETAMFEQLRSAQGVFDALVDGLVTVDCEGRVLFCNATARILLGDALPRIQPGEWATRYTYLLPDGAQPERLDEVPLIQALKGQSVTRQEMHVRGEGIRGVWLSVTARPVMDTAGHFEWAYIVLRDINLRKWAEQRQILQERAMESTGEGIAIIDARHPDQPIIYVNPGLERLTAHPARELLGQPWAALLPASGDAAKAATLQEEFREGEPFTTELHAVREDGTSLWYRLSLTAAHDSRDTLTHYIAVLSDITEMMKAEEKLKESNVKLEAAYRRMKRNLDAAARLQQALLPTVLPEMAGIRFEWRFEPAEDLSGDILNVIQLDENHVALYLLDVTGHGVASAMLSVTVSRSLIPLHSNTTLLYDRKGPDGAFVVAPASKVATRLAMRFPWDPTVGQFFTLVYGILDRRTREFTYTCAGHAPPICLTPEGACITKRSRDLPIGIGDSQFEEHVLELTPGARLYLYSDGVTEARNPREGGFGRQRFLDTLRDSQTLSLRQSLDTVLVRLKDWRAGEPAHDDVSLLAVEMKGTSCTP